MAAIGTYIDPSHKPCFEACRACFRCVKKESKHSGSSFDCDSCSGCMDPAGQIDEHPDHFCQCTVGVLRWKAKTGRLLVRKYPKNPFAGQIKQLSETEDNRDWKAYLQEYREKMENPYISPITAVIDGKKAFYNDDLVGFYDENGNQIG